MASHAEGGGPSDGIIHPYGTASGDYSHAEGKNVVASGYASHAEGGYTTASGDFSHAEGATTTASGFNSHAEGVFTRASSNSAHAEGMQTIASGESSHAEGSGTEAGGYASHAEGIQTTASGYASHAAGCNAKATNDYTYVWSDGTTIGSTTTRQYTVYAENGIRLLGGTVYTANGTVSTWSDRRLKQNIVPITNALGKVGKINGVYYEMIAKPGQVEVGVIAQEVETVLPEVVGQSDGYQCVDYAKLTALLIEAVKELKGENADKETEIQALQAGMAELLQRLEAVEAK